MEKILYHGSPQSLKSLKPYKDKRTNIFGIWLTEIKEHAMIFSCIEESHKINIEWNTKQGIFTGAKITMKKPFLDHGWLYTIEIEDNNLERIKEHSYICFREVFPIKKEKITKNRILQLDITLVQE